MVSCKITRQHFYRLPESTLKLSSRKQSGPILRSWYKPRLLAEDRATASSLMSQPRQSSNVPSVKQSRKQTVIRATSL